MYDPLVDSNIGVAASYPASYWATTEVVNRYATSYGKLSTDIDTDVVIIGGGYTGFTALSGAVKTVSATVSTPAGAASLLPVGPI